MTSGYYCAIFPFCGGGKKKDDKKTKAFYDQATTGIPVKRRQKKTKTFYDWITAGIPVKIPDFWPQLFESRTALSIG